MNGDSWAFGWTHLIAIAGLLITVGIAAVGFRTFAVETGEA